MREDYMILIFLIYFFFFRFSPDAWKHVLRNRRVKNLGATFTYHCWEFSAQATIRNLDSHHTKFGFDAMLRDSCILSARMI